MPKYEALDFISQPWKTGGMFHLPPTIAAADVTTDNYNKIEPCAHSHRSLMDPIVWTHFLLIISAACLYSKGHYAPAALIIIGMVISVVYHMSVETCMEDMDMIFCIFTAVIVYATVYTYGAKYIPWVIGLNVLSLIVWWYAGKWYIPKEDEHGRKRNPSNHPYYCSLHTMFHVLAFSGLACLSFFVNPCECPKILP